MSIGTADALYDNIRGFLRLTARVVKKKGDYIDTGEKFTLRFTATNAAYSAFSVEFPKIVFLRPRIKVMATRYARPDPAPPMPGLRFMPDQVLWPGESTFVDVECTALEPIDAINDLYTDDYIVRAQIFADLDQNKFFEMRNVLDVYQAIRPS